MNQRVKQLRKTLRLSQSQFGSKLCVTGAAVSRIEKGDRAVTDQMAKAICNEFNVNPDWLYNGAGEMFREFPITLLEQLCREFDLDELEKQLIKSFISLDKDQRQIITQFLQNATHQ